MGAQLGSLGFHLHFRAQGFFMAALRPFPCLPWKSGLQTTYLQQTPKNRPINRTTYANKKKRAHLSSFGSASEINIHQGIMKKLLYGPAIFFTAWNLAKGVLFHEPSQFLRAGISHLWVPVLATSQRTGENELCKSTRNTCLQQMQKLQKTTSVAGKKRIVFT